MNIAEKCALLKADMDALHKAGGNTEEAFEQGRQDVISKSKYIPKTASGKGVFLTDVSEVAHKVKVYADTPTEVTVCGKNLFDVSKVTEKSGENTGYVVKNNDGSITVTSTANVTNVYIGTLSDLAPSLREGDKVVFNAITDSTKKTVYIKNTKTTLPFGTVLEVTGEHLTSSIALYSSSANVASTFSEIQLEHDNVTAYEPYQEPQTITATPNGTETDSMCPIMNFLTDGEITVDYYSSFGMNEEWNRFWDSYQDYGKRKGYGTAFSEGWNETIFKPKYDIKPEVATNIFYGSNFGNLEKILSDCGVVLDLSKCANLTYGFGFSTITHIPVVNLSKCTNTSYLFANFSESSTSAWRSQLKSVRKIISSETTVFANNAFNNCRHLEHCIFDGTIASDINLQWSPKLDLESLISLFSCLKSFASDDTNYMTKTITLSAESWALTDTQEFMNEFEGNYGKALAGYFGWKTA